ncbi:MAG: hypothetical protein O7C68_04330 [Rickettsia endosymbiont of Ixodes ricinus]|nr:hypothetical protein [Rickettsia endosymbiont of Ixodes ricinus]
MSFQALSLISLKESSVFFLYFANMPPTSETGDSITLLLSSISIEIILLFKISLTFFGRTICPFRSNG